MKISVSSAWKQPHIPFNWENIKWAQPPYMIKYIKNVHMYKSEIMRMGAPSVSSIVVSADE